MLLLAADVLVCGVLYALTKSWVLPLALNVLAALGLLAFLWVNKRLRRTHWYQSLFVDPQHQTYPDNVWYRVHDERNYDVVNLGSSGGKWAFDYAPFASENEGLPSEKRSASFSKTMPFPVKGMNWAQQPQTLVDDFNLLKNFHSILRKQGYVLITIMPFTSLNKRTGLLDTLKYVGTLDSTLLDKRFKRKAYLIRKFPLLLGKRAVKALAKSLVGKDSPKAVPNLVEKNPMTDAQLAADALRFVNGWKRQFGIADWEGSLTETNQQGRAVRIKLMQDLIDFCTERGYTPVYVIPPVTAQLNQYYTQCFKQIYIYEYLQQVGRDVRLLDYSDDQALQDKDLYFNSFFMNQRGARQFTQRVLQDLAAINN